MDFLEKQVPSLELCIKLKELGFPQHGEGFYWVGLPEDLILEENPQKRWVVVFLTEIQLMDYVYNREPFVKAPSIVELNEYLNMNAEEANEKAKELIKKLTK